MCGLIGAGISNLTSHEPQQAPVVARRALTNPKADGEEDDGRRAAFLELARHLRLLEADELRVLARIAARLEKGVESYGPLRVSTDRRDFRGKEAREELEDFLVYTACAWLKAEGGAR